MKDTEALRENLKNIYKSAATAIESLSAFRDNLKVLNKVRDSCAFFSAIAGFLTVPSSLKQNISIFRESIEAEDDATTLLRDTLGITFKVHERFVLHCNSMPLTF